MAQAKYQGHNKRSEKHRERDAKGNKAKLIQPIMQSERERQQKLVFG